jgi:hypothetical protein
VAALVVLALAAAPILVAYLLDLLGLPFPPWPMLAAALAAGTATVTVLRRGAVRAAADLWMWTALVAAVAAWLVWVARPALLPLSTGSDLTHHLLLIRYLEQHWRLVHDPGVGRYLGEMAQYTPGSHILAALAGAWSGTDGLRALHTVQALAVALKVGFLWLIALRLLPADLPRRAMALLGVVLLWGAPVYFLGGMLDFGFVAQVVAELFAVALWWIAVAWDTAPSTRLSALFAAVAAAAFLTWPVYAGPPLLAFFVTVSLRRDLPFPTRLQHLLLACVPFGVVALTYFAGRLQWLQLAGTGGASPWPSVASYGWATLALSLIGLVRLVTASRGRATVLFVLAALAQTAALYLAAVRSGADRPYMALKMFYLLLLPMVACAAIGAGTAWAALRDVTRRLAGRRLSLERSASPAAWGLVAVAAVVVFRPLVLYPQRLHPQPPAISAPLYEAGRWARAHVPPACVEYLVGDDETAYWLHLAVLGNPRVWSRSADNSTYEPVAALVRWLTPNGLPYAIADLPALPRDVREDLDVMRRFDTAAVVRRRGPWTCAEPR